jgi:aspartate carbamoyltransferase regulatory subunit
MEKKSLMVAAIENGTVIDHIPTDKVFTIASLLQLDKCTDQVTIGNNFESDKMGRKGIIKIANRFFSDAEISRLAAVCPNIRLCIIKNYDVAEKKVATLPDEFINVVRCANPVCITNNEPMKTVFYVTDKEHGTVKCRYCGKEQHLENIKLV